MSLACIRAVPVPVNAPLLPTPAPLIVIASAPAIVTLLIFNVAPDATVVPLAAVPNAVAFAATKVPTLTAVAPV